MQKILPCLLGITLLLASCNLFNNYGKRVKINDKNEVYYKGEGVTETDAKKLGDYLVTEKYFDNSNEATAQLTKDGDAYLVHLVIDEDKLKANKEQITNEFWLMQSRLSENVFSNAKTRIIFADDHLKDLQTLDNLTKVVSNNAEIYIKGDGVTTDQAKKLASILREKNLFGESSPNIVMEKQNGTYKLGIVYDPDYYSQNKTTVAPTFQLIQWLASEEVFNNATTEVSLTSPYFIAFDRVTPFTSEQKDRLAHQATQNEDQAATATPAEQSDSTSGSDDQ